jgi:hypothetical protein
MSASTRAVAQQGAATARRVPQAGRAVAAAALGACGGFGLAVALAAGAPLLTPPRIARSPRAVRQPAVGPACLLSAHHARKPVSGTRPVSSSRSHLGVFCPFRQLATVYGRTAVLTHAINYRRHRSSETNRLTLEVRQSDRHPPHILPYLRATVFMSRPTTACLRRRISSFHVGTESLHVGTESLHVRTESLHVGTSPTQM